MSSSLFDLETDINQIQSVNGGINRNSYQQVACSRDVVGSQNFSNGAQHFRWNQSGNTHWLPSKSYLRLRLKLQKGTGATQLLSSDDIAPTMAQFASLYQSLEFRINDKTVSKISDFVPQIDVLETRLRKSKAWIDSVGASSNYLNADFNNRKDDITADGKVIVPYVSSSTRVQMGYDALNTVEVSAAGVITFAANGGAAPPAANANDLWKIGDQIEIDCTAAGVGTLSYRVSSVISATTLQANNIAPTAMVAGGFVFRRIRTAVPSGLQDARNNKEYELIWTPPLSIFKIDKALPLGKYELILNPQTASSIGKYMVESSLADKILGTDFNFEVVDMFLYINTVEGPRVDNLTYYLDLENTGCQAEAVKNYNFSQSSFDISPSTYGITVAYQDARAGSNTLFSPTKFKSYDALPSEVGEELKLNRMYLSYAGQQMPAPDADPNFSIALAKDNTTQRYIESQLHSGNYFSEGGCETLVEYHNRGSYYFFKIARDGNDRSTRLQINQGFDTTTVPATIRTRVLAFSHYKSIVAVKIAEGRIIDVQVADN